MSRFLGRIVPQRKIDAISAILLPYRQDGRPDYAGFEKHLLRTAQAGIQPAVNMDTGFGPDLSPQERREVLLRTRKALGTAPFVAGAIAQGESSDLLSGYEASVRAILEVEGTPIIFQSALMEGRTPQELEDLYRRIVAPCPKALAFELGPMFAPFGRIYDSESFRRLMSIPRLSGAKHSSLSRSLELDRLELRDRGRPDFKIYTGNDLAIDMVMCGSDYLLGLSTFDPDAFALRDRWWAAGDDRFFELNDALQALGAVAFRDPVPAYKDSAAVYLGRTGRLVGALPHPRCPRRPPWEGELLEPLARKIAEACAR